MSELSMALGAAAPPHTIEHEGRTYTFHLIDQRRKNEIEKRLYRRARDLVYGDRDELTDAEYAAELARVRENYEKGRYSMYGDLGAPLLASTPGVLVLLDVVTGLAPEEALALVAARGAEVNTVMGSVMRESFGRVAPAPSPEAPGG